MALREVVKLEEMVLLLSSGTAIVVACPSFPNHASFPHDPHSPFVGHVHSVAYGSCVDGA